MVEIQINESDFVFEEKQYAIWKDLCLKIAKYLAIENKIISIAFTDEETIALLNSQYRNKSGVTDVLSFPLSSLHSEDQILGEIVISVPIAAKQAPNYGNTLAEEISFLLLHGMLHLAGYDHDEAHRGLMREKEKELAKLLALRKR